jgi:hypothetical protein
MIEQTFIDIAGDAMTVGTAEATPSGKRVAIAIYNEDGMTSVWFMPWQIDAIIAALQTARDEAC